MKYVALPFAVLVAVWINVVFIEWDWKLALIVFDIIFLNVFAPVAYFVLDPPHEHDFDCVDCHHEPRPHGSYSEPTRTGRSSSDIPQHYTGDFWP